MDINNNLQTNTFLKGMNTDTSDALLSNQEYRFAENIQLVTDTNGNDGEVRLVDGVKIYRKQYFGKIYAATIIRNYGIIIGTKRQTTVGTNVNEYGWSIFRINNDDKITTEDSGSPKEIFGPCDAPIGDNLSLVTRWESDNNVKLYIADGENYIRSINIFHTDYDTNGNAPKDIKYLGEYSNIGLAVPTIELQNGGHIKYHVVQYAYVLYKRGGASTFSSPVSKLIRLYDDNRGYKTGVTTSKSVQISVNNGSLVGLDRIRIYRISYVQNGQEPVVHIIHDNSYTGGLYTYTDYGNDISELSASEFTSLTSIKIRPQVIESKNNYLFAGNISYDLDKVDTLYKDAVLTLSDSSTMLDNIVYFRRGLRYRFGVIFYTNDGRKTSVLCITDYDVPESSGDSVVGRIAFELDLTGITNDARTKLYRYEIVRCERTLADSKTIVQGICGLPIKISDDLKMASPFMSFSRLDTDSVNPNSSDVKTSYHTDSSDVVMFACPEHCYDDSNVIQFLKKNASSLKLCPVVSYTSGSWSSGHLINVEDETYPRSAIRKTDHRDIYVRAISKINMALSGYEPFAGFSSAQIIDVEETVSPKWNEFATDSGDITLLDNVYAVGNKQYVNWYAPAFYTTNGFDDSSYKKDAMQNEDISNDDKYVIASGKKCLLLHTSTSIPAINEISDKMPITVCDIRNANYNKNLVYGGNSNEAKNNCVFYSFGNVFTYTPESTTVSGEVLGGDCFNGNFIYNSAHYFSHNLYKYVYRMAVVYDVPIASSIDLKGTSGDLYPYLTQRNKYFLQDDPCSIVEDDASYIQENSAYIYDDVYSTLPYIKHVPVTYTELSTDKFDTRVVYSNEKTNGEEIDNWLLFESANFIDADSRYGLITNLRLFKDALMFWQEHATGLLSVNERTIIQDASNNNIILGNGDVLLRYDYISTIYGMHKGNFSDTQSNTTLYWWDYNTKELLMYGGDAATPMSKMKNISNYINSNEKIENPALLYDNKYKDVWFNVVGNYPLIYNEYLQQFVGINKIPFDASMQFQDGLYFIRNYGLYGMYNLSSIFVRYNEKDRTQSYLYGSILSDSLKPNELYPYIKYVVNTNPQYNKVFDLVVFGGNFYGNSNRCMDGDPKYDDIQNDTGVYHTTGPLGSLQFTFNTNLKQTGKIIDGEGITNREYDFRAAVPREGSYENNKWTTREYGDRLRGKTMQCEFWSTSNYNDFSLQYITTKYRMSWS